MRNQRMECTMCGERVRSPDAMRSHLERQHTAQQRREYTQAMAEAFGDLSDGAWYQALMDIGLDPAWLAESDSEVSQ